MCTRHNMISSAKEKRRKYLSWICGGMQIWAFGCAHKTLVIMEIYKITLWPLQQFHLNYNVSGISQTKENHFRSYGPSGAFVGLLSLFFFIFFAKSLLLRLKRKTVILACSYGSDYLKWKHRFSLLWINKHNKVYDFCCTKFTWRDFHVSKLK